MGNASYSVKNLFLDVADFVRGFAPTTIALAALVLLAGVLLVAYRARTR